MRYIEWSLDQRDPEIPPEPALEIQIIPEDLEEIAVREGIHERIQAEIHQGNKEEEARAEEMLEVPPEWNEVPDLMMEEEDILPEATGSTKRRRDEISGGWGKGWKEDDIQPDKHVYIHPKYLREYKIQRNSILKIGMKFSRKKTSGKRQISGSESHRWCL